MSPPSDNEEDGEGNDLIGYLFLLFIQTCFLATWITHLTSLSLSFQLCRAGDGMIMGITHS